MPTYEYICGDCDNKLEHFQSITANPIRKCPACGNLSLKRLIGAGSGVIFKGSGFYQTDYRTESYKTGQKNEKTSQTKKETKDTPTNKKTTKQNKKATANKKNQSQSKPPPH